MLRPVSGAPHIPTRSPSCFHHLINRCLVCSQFDFHIELFPKNFVANLSKPLAQPLRTCRSFDRSSLDHLWLCDIAEFWFQAGAVDDGLGFGGKRVFDMSTGWDAVRSPV